MDKLNVDLKILDSKLKDDVLNIINNTVTLDDSKEPDLFLCDSSYIKSNSTPNLEKTIVLSNLKDEENILDLVCSKAIPHIIGVNGSRLKEELLFTLKDFQDKNFWGIERFLKHQKIHTTHFYTSTDLNDKIKDLVEHVQFEGFFSSPGEYIQTIVNELVTNAIFNAPNANSSRDRTTPMSLSKDEMVTFKIGRDDDYLVLSVEDTFGSLTMDRFKKSLKRSAEEKTPENKRGGAGLGLYLVYQYTNQLFINIAPGKKTEVICLLDRSKRYKNYRERITSFHLYQEKNP